MDVKIEKGEYYYIKLPESIIDEFGIREGDQFSVDTDGESIRLVPFEPVNVDLDDYTLARLAERSVLEGKTVNEIIIDILTEAAEKEDGDE